MVGRNVESKKKIIIIKTENTREIRNNCVLLLRNYIR